MSKKIIIEEFGGADQLKVIQEQVGEPGPNEVRIAHKACGLNFIDIYQRTGLYPMPLPHTLVTEAAGLVDAVGSNVTHLNAGDRVAYAFNAPAGAYCEMRVMPADQVCVLPDSISFEEGAARHGLQQAKPLRVTNFVVTTINEPSGTAYPDEDLVSASKQPRRSISRQR